MPSQPTLRSMPRLAVVLAFLFVVATRSPCAGAELELSRQPYLQSLTADSVVIVWRTARPAIARVELRGPLGERTVRHDVLEMAPAVLVDGLEPATVYSYRVVSAVVDESGLQEAASPEHSFRTAPVDGETPVRVVVFGDAGAGTPEQLAVRDVALAAAPDLVLVTGDLVYPYGAEAYYRSHFFDVYAELFSRSCVYPAPGNHDLLDSTEAYIDQFHLPSNNPLGTERYYSFDFGAGHFVALDTTEDFALETAQLEWLREDLASTTQPWKIVYFHHTVYGTGFHGADFDKPARRAALTPIFDEFGVDLALCGHDHLYERTHPVRNDTVRDGWQGGDYHSPRGTIYVVTGGGGQVLYERSYLADEIYAAFFAQVHHAVDISLTATRLVMKVRVSDGTLIDPVVIHKDTERPPFTLQRGDTNGDGLVLINDPIRILRHLFVGVRMPCPMTGDWNGDNRLTIVDPIAALRFLFSDGVPAASPFGACGPTAVEQDAFCVEAPCG